MYEKEWEKIRSNLTKWILIPIGALAVLEIVWNLSGVYGLSALPFWAIKLAIFAYAGYLSVESPTMISEDARARIR